MPYHLATPACERHFTTIKPAFLLVFYEDFFVRTVFFTALAGAFFFVAAGAFLTGAFFVAAGLRAGVFFTGASATDFFLTVVLAFAVAAFFTSGDGSFSTTISSCGSDV